MPCIRRSSIQKKHLQLGDLTMNCESFAEFTALRDTSQNGNLASFEINRKKEAKKSVALYPFHGSHLRGIRQSLFTTTLILEGHWF